MLWIGVLVGFGEEGAVQNRARDRASRGRRYLTKVEG